MEVMKKREKVMNASERRPDYMFYLHAVRGRPADHIRAALSYLSCINMVDLITCVLIQYIVFRDFIL